MLDAVATARSTDAPEFGGPPGVVDADATEASTVEVLLRSIDAFCERHVDARAIDARAHVDRSLLDGLAELGLFGLSIPESHGGFGLSLGAVGDVVAGLARHDRAIATSVGLHLGLGTRGLVAFGGAALQDAWLPALAAGASIAAFATTEAGAGSDLAAIRTRGTEEGGGLRLDGEKIFVTNGGIADVFTITAATPGLGGRRRGHSLVLLAREDGLVTGPEEHKLGLRGSSTTTLHIDGVHVGMDRILGTPGDGMGHLAHVLAWGRAVMAAGCRGTARAALHATDTHVATRRQFGRTLASMDVVRAQLAAMHARDYAMGALVRHASAQRDPTVLAVLSGSAKVFATEITWGIVDRALQLHGGVGYIEETGIALLLRDSRITRIFEGANDVLRVHRGLVEATQPLPRPLLSTGEAETNVGREVLARRADGLDAEVSSWRAELVHTHGARLLARPAILHALGEAAILRDATDAAVRQVTSDLDAARAELWLHEAEARVSALFRCPPDATLVDRALPPLDVS